MDDQLTLTVQAYETPRVIDYGDLREMTAACALGTGGDAYHAGGTLVYGTSNPAFGCKSNP